MRSKTKNLIGLGRTTAAKTFTRNGNLSDEPRNERHCEHERRRQGAGCSMVDGGPADCGAVGVMEVWPSSVGLRGQTLNHPQVHWLKTVVLSVVGKGATRARQVWVGEMSDGRSMSSAVDVSKILGDVKTRVSAVALGGAWGLPGLLPRRHPAYRQHEPDRGASMERVKAHPETVTDGLVARGRTPSGGIREGQSTVAGCAGGLARSSCEARAYRSGGGAKGRGRPGSHVCSTVREEAHV
jgi:hypothetical protein